MNLNRITNNANLKFQALDTLPGDVQQVLIAEGRVFMTYALFDDKLFTGTIITRKPGDWQEAWQLAYQRGFDETVEGNIVSIGRGNPAYPKPVMN